MFDDRQQHNCYLSECNHFLIIKLLCTFIVDNLLQTNYFLITLNYLIKKLFYFFYITIFLDCVLFYLSVFKDKRLSHNSSYIRIKSNFKF